MSSGSSRDKVMDALKGVAILLVVLGHAVEGLPKFDSNPLFVVIYAFHMPLFMFISGYVAFYSRDNTSWIQMRKKFALLVVPFAAWYGLSYAINGTFMTMGLRAYVRQGILSPDWGLWFLWVLFLNFALLAVALRAERYLKGWAIPLAWVALQLVPTGAYGFSLFKWHFAFFALGYLIHRHAARLARLRRPAALASLVAFPLAVQFWNRVYPPSFAGRVSQALIQIHAHQLYGAVIGVYTYAVPLLGIVAAWALISLLPLQAPGTFRVLGWFGTCTLDIYVTHQYLMRFGFGQGPMQVLSSFAIGLGGSLAISFLILRRNEVTAHILLGKPYPKRAPKPAPARVPVAVPVPAS